MKLEVGIKAFGKSQIIGPKGGNIMSKKISVIILSIPVMLLLSSFVWAAEPYPTREIELIVPFNTGGGIDLMSRALAPKLSEILGKPVLVVNKPGAAGTVGTALAVQRKPDGHTLVSLSPSCILFAPNFQKVPFDPIKDITYIAGWVDQPFGIQVRADSPWKTLDDLIDYAKKNPGKVKHGHLGTNSLGHIYMEAIAKDRGVDWIHVPYQGDGTTIPALLGGHVDVATIAVAWVPHARSGQIRPLALFGTKRFKSFPELPTLNELGFNYYAGGAGFLGVGAPAGLPEEIRKKLEDTFKTAVNTPEFVKTTENLSLEVWFRPGDELKTSAKEGLKAINDMAVRVGLKK